MDARWGRFAGSEHYANIVHEEGEKYYDNEDLLSLDGSDDARTSRRRRYHEFNESHDMRILIVLEKGLVFVDTHVFKKALKRYAVQHGFDFKYKHNDCVRVSAVCKEKYCIWRIHESLDAKKKSTQIETFVLDHQCENQYQNSRADVEYIATQYMPSFLDDPTWTPYAL
jgi:hypothetical protein